MNAHQNLRRIGSFRPRIEALEDRAVPASLFADFDGDGYGDLAVSAPGETVNGNAGAGAVYVLYGTSDGLAAADHQRFTQEDFGDVSASNDSFGHAVTAGDFNGDGRTDLAIGAPYKDVSAKVDAGKVYVLYGEMTTGLSAADGQKWAQPAGVVTGAEAGDYFGSALAAGNFNGDVVPASGPDRPIDDLAIGAPGEGFNLLSGPMDDAGEVDSLYGSAASGLVSAGFQLWTQNSPNIIDGIESGDQFGYTLTTGDFNGDGEDDLAIGVPYEDQSTSLTDTGAVHVIYGKAGVGLHHGIGDSTTDNQLLQQTTTGTGDRRAEVGDRYGFALAAGEFGDDGLDDLVIGIPFEDIGSVTDAGAVHVIYGGGTVTGLGSDSRFVYQGSTIGIFVVPGFSDYGDQFGYALAAANFNGDNTDDLAIGVPGKALDSGAVIALYGDYIADGLAAHDVEYWTQDTEGISGLAEEGDGFGTSLAAGDFDGDTFADLAIGVPFENIGTTIADAGAFNVLYGDHGHIGLDASGSQIWWQELFGYLSEPGEGLGWGLAGR